jgi:hypothetical protein
LKPTPQASEKPPARDRERTTFSTVADQSGHYGENLPDFLAALTPGKLRFLYESTGVETFFRHDEAERKRPKSLIAERAGLASLPLAWLIGTTEIVKWQPSESRF